MNWYDWNLVSDATSWYFLQPRRDWSAWIDTIETWNKLNIYASTSSSSGLICMNWYDWNNMISPPYRVLVIQSGLICMNWYDWNTTHFLYHSLSSSRRDWSAWIDTIETSSSVMLQIMPFNSSGLICMNWYDWNDREYLSWETGVNTVGIDLHELIRLKPCCHDLPIVILIAVGIDLHELIRLKHSLVMTCLADLYPGRDWSAWIDTIETYT